MSISSEQSPSLPAVASSSRQNQRTVISCFSCRHKKLRCDRTRPICSNCAKRGIDCAYATPVERLPTQNRSGNAQLYNRIRHLEDLIATLVTRRMGTAEAAPSRPASLSSGSSSPKASLEDVSEATKNKTPTSKADGQCEYVQEFGHMRMNDSEMTYVSASHWRAILDNITSIKEDIEAEDEQLDPTTQAIYEGPSLLLGICTPSSIDEILSSIPPRSTVDRLVSQYFNSGEPSILILHTLTFQNEYDRFWSDPHGTPVTWISLLFSVMCLGVLFYLRIGEDPPSMSWSPKEVAGTFRLRAVECLVLGNYTRPKAYTIESLLLHIQCEHLSSQTPQTSVWVLWGMVVRLSLSVGLHRDSKHFPGISCFEGEMRRRKWALIVQLDLLISYVAGLPRMVREGDGDTELPHNLLDEDFDKSSTELPPSRSNREVTPVSYSICKGKLTRVFGLIIDEVSSVKSSSQETVVELDRKLTEVYSFIPPHLQLRSPNFSVTDSPTLLMRKYSLDILYHKASCTLHRIYFNVSPAANAQLQEFRTRCLDSAIQLLRHHVTINQETQPGGLLSRDKWFAMSLMSHDFQLAAMIIYLELQHRENRQSTRMVLVNDQDRVSNGESEPHSKEELLRALEASHDLWGASASYSKDAAKASEALALMLKKVRGSSTSVDSSNISASGAATEAGGMTTLHDGHISVDSGAATAEQDFRPAAFSSNGEGWIPINQESMLPPEPMLNTSFSIPAAGNSHKDGVNVMADADFSTDFNWDLWDSQMQNMGIHPDWMNGQEL